MSGIYCTDQPILNIGLIQIPRNFCANFHSSFNSRSEQIISEHHVVDFPFKPFCLVVACVPAHLLMAWLLSHMTRSGVDTGRSKSTKPCGCPSNLDSAGELNEVSVREVFLEMSDLCERQNNIIKGRDATLAVYRAKLEEMQESTITIIHDLMETISLRERTDPNAEFRTQCLMLEEQLSIANRQLRDRRDEGERSTLHLTARIKDLEIRQRRHRSEFAEATLVAEQLSHAKDDAEQKLAKLNRINGRIQAQTEELEAHNKSLLAKLEACERDREKLPSAKLSEPAAQAPSPRTVDGEPSEKVLEQRAFPSNSTSATGTSAKSVAEAVSVLFEQPVKQAVLPDWLKTTAETVSYVSEDKQVVTHPESDTVHTQESIKQGSKKKVSFATNFIGQYNCKENPSTQQAFHSKSKRLVRGLPNLFLPTLSSPTFISIPGLNETKNRARTSDTDQLKQAPVPEETNSLIAAAEAAAAHPSTIYIYSKSKQNLFHIPETTPRSVSVSGRALREQINKRNSSGIGVSPVATTSLFQLPAFHSLTNQEFQNTPPIIESRMPQTSNEHCTDDSEATKHNIKVNLDQDMGDATHHVVRTEDGHLPFHSTNEQSLTTSHISLDNPMQDVPLSQADWSSQHCDIPPRHVAATASPVFESISLITDAPMNFDLDQVALQAESPERQIDITTTEASVEVDMADSCVEEQTKYQHSNQLLESVNLITKQSNFEGIERPGYHSLVWRNEESGIDNDVDSYVDDGGAYPSTTASPEGGRLAFVNDGVLSRCSSYSTATREILDMTESDAIDRAHMNQSPLPGEISSTSDISSLGEEEMAVPLFAYPAIIGRVRDDHFGGEIDSNTNSVADCEAVGEDGHATQTELGSGHPDYEKCPSAGGFFNRTKIHGVEVDPKKTRSESRICSFSSESKKATTIFGNSEIPSKPPVAPELSNCPSTVFPNLSKSSTAAKSVSGANSEAQLNVEESFEEGDVNIIVRPGETAAVTTSSAPEPPTNSRPKLAPKLRKQGNAFPNSLSMNTTTPPIPISRHVSPPPQAQPQPIVPNALAAPVNVPLEKRRARIIACLKLYNKLRAILDLHHEQTANRFEAWNELNEKIIEVMNRWMKQAQVEMELFEKETGFARTLEDFEQYSICSFDPAASVAELAEANGVTDLTEYYFLLSVDC